MPRRAWIYLCLVLAVAAVWSMRALLDLHQNPPTQHLVAFITLIGLATLSQLHKAVTSTNRQSQGTTISYSAILVFFAAGIFLLPPACFVLLVLIPHLIEWLVARLTRSTALAVWYIQPFNIAMHVIAGLSAQGLYGAALPRLTGTIEQAAIMALFALGLYFLLNQLLLGVALMLVRGLSFREAGIMDVEASLPDFVNLCLGYLISILWQLTPWLLLPALMPMILIHRALKVPQLKKEAHIDAKTGLLTPHRFNELFKAEMERARRFDRPLVVMMADLDMLRNINNTYGHLAGDAVLEGIGRIINQTMREYDIAGRFGGEEFCIILPETEEGEARQFAERLRRRIAEHDFEVPTSANPIRVTISIGIASYPADATSVNELIHAADVAVYQAKFQGRNRVISAGAVPQSFTLEDVSRASRLDAPLPSFTPRVLPAEPAERPVARGEEGRAAEMAVQPAGQERSRFFWLFVYGVIAAGLVAVTWGNRYDPAPEWTHLALVALLAGIAELFQLHLYEREGTFSVSVAFAFSAALIDGVQGVAIVAAVIALVHRLRFHSGPVQGAVLYKTLFNWGTHVIAGLAPVLALRLLAVPVQIESLYLLLLPLLLAALLHYLISTGLVAAAIALSRRGEWIAIWRGQYGWMVWHYLGLCMLGAFMAASYISHGPMGVALFTLPVFLSRHAQAQYVTGTRASMQELIRLNGELTRANCEVLRASKAIQQLNDELFLILARIIDARDPFVSGHATQVSHYATIIAREMGLPNERVERVRLAGFLHDIGKIGIAEAVLQKPARLTDEEYEHIKRHATLGGNLLESSYSLRQFAPFVRHHHERWDGTGYPDGLKGEKIPLEARILSVCDAVEAMASDRPYQAALTLPDIIRELKRCAGSQFDPDVVASFIRIAERQGEAFIVNSAAQVATKHATSADFLKPDSEGWVPGGMTQISTPLQ